MSAVIAYKNFAAHRNISHIGLGVAAIKTAKVLRREGVMTEVWPILNASDLRARLIAAPQQHVIVSAPWIPTAELQALSTDFPQTRFAVNCHSNVGFLQADRHGVKLIREMMELELGTANVHLAGNSKRFCDWVKAAFGSSCAYLPNLYWMESSSYPRPQRAFSGGTLRVGVFGATRPLKNLMSAAGAALEIARNLRASLELWGRRDGAGRCAGDGTGRSGRESGDERLAVVAEVSADSGTYALAVAAELHRVVQYGDGGRRGRRSAVRGFSGD